MGNRGLQGGVRSTNGTANNEAFLFRDFSFEFNKLTRRSARFRPPAFFALLGFEVVLGCFQLV